MSTYPPIEPILSQARLLLDDIRVAEQALDHQQVARLSRRVINDLSAISSGPARDILQDAAFQALVQALERLRQYDNALDAIELWEARTRSDRSLITAHMVLGRIRFGQGRFQDALTGLEEVISRAEATGFLPELGQASLLEANVLWSMGQTDRALLVAQQALIIARQLADRHMEGQALSAIASAQHYVGHFFDAIRSDLRAAEAFDVVGDRYRLAETCIDLGKNYQQLYDTATALSYLEEARRIFGDAPPPIALQRTLGTILIDSGQTRPGLDLLQEALDTARASGERIALLQTLYSMASVQLGLGHIPQARKLAEELLSQAAQHNTIRYAIRAMLILGPCAQQIGDHTSAHEFLHLAFVAAQQVADRNIIWQSHSALAALLDSAQPDMARVHRQIAVEMVRDLADSIADAGLRQIFEGAAPIRALLASAE